MPQSTRNTKLILRIGVMVMAALTLGLAVRLVLENRELEKLLPATSTRMLLLMAAPLTSLAMLHLVLAVRTLSIRNLMLEVLLLVGEGALFIAIVSPLLIGSWVTFAGEDCGRWIRPCPDELIWVPVWWTQPAGFIVGATLISGAIGYVLIRTRD
jgi:hypothetical protein